MEALTYNVKHTSPASFCKKIIEISQTCKQMCYGTAHHQGKSIPPVKPGGGSIIE